MENILNVDKSQLSPKHQQVLEVIEKIGLKVAYMSVEDIAKEAQVSTATISRFWTHANFQSFKEFKMLVKKRIETTPENKLRNFFLDIGTNDLFDKLINQNYEHLLQTHTHLDRKALNESVHEIVNAERVFVHAPSSSEGLGSLLTYRLRRFGLSVMPIAKSGHEIYESMIHFHSGDVIVIFQFVKMLPETKVILDYADKKQMKTILFTDQLETSMNELADIVLYTNRGDTWEFHSMVAPTAVVETLIMRIGMELEDITLQKMEKLSELRKEYNEIVSN